MSAVPSLDRVFNRTLVIDKCIQQAYRAGYRIRIGTTFVDSLTKTCCPMGAVMMFNPKALSPDFIRGFAKGFDNESPNITSHEMGLGYKLGIYYRGEYGKKGIQRYREN